jgi:hypothetical protein
MRAESLGFILAFILPTIIFSALIAILTSKSHSLVRGFAWVFIRLMRVSASRW